MGEHVFVRLDGYVREVSTILRGNAAEAAVLNALIRAGLIVLLPFGEGAPYDLMVDIGHDSIKVQVKCARIRDNCITCNSCGTDHGRGRESYEGRADMFGVHSPQLDRVYMIPVVACPHFQTRLRCTPTRNNQQRGVRYAGDYTVEDWARSLGRAAA
jgi:hypothetical protein